MRLWLSAINELLCRYGTIFSAVWRERLTLSHQKERWMRDSFYPRTWS